MATRTWVSGVGDDANPGSRTAPCKTFAGAISKTDPGGEINVIDPGGFGTLTITKAITIDGGGVFASILAAGTNGINVNAGPNDVVTLRNLSFDGAGLGLNGIVFNTGAVLHIERCVIFNFSQRGVAFQPGAASRLFIKDTIIRNNNNATNGGAVFIAPAASGSASVTLDNVRMDQNLAGVSANDRSVVLVRNCIATGSINAGFAAAGSAVAAVMNLENCVASDNNASANTVGILSAGAQAIVRISNVMAVNNGVGLFTTGGGAIVSFGNNRIAGNVTDGAPTSTPGQK
jgi:Right handed beta helix region